MVNHNQDTPATIIGGGSIGTGIEWNTGHQYQTAGAKDAVKLNM